MIGVNDLESVVEGWLPGACTRYLGCNTLGDKYITYHSYAVPAIYLW